MPPRKNLYITVCIVLCALFILFGSIDLASYKNHHREIPVSGEQQYLSDVWLRAGPLSEDWLVKKIDTAEKRVWVAVYTFTVPSLREALKRAQGRGVDVRIILEKFPFGNTTINRETEQFFKTHSLQFYQSGEGQFAFMHAKYMIFDSEWVVETANWTRASFASNREFFMQGDDIGILTNLSQIFLSDFSGKKGISQDIRLLSGPVNARERLQKFLDGSQKNIAIYAPSFSDKELITHLTQLCYNGRITRILLASYEETGENANYGDCIQVRKMKKPLHAKVIIRDSREAFVGSFNYTKNSLENNREVGLFISGEDMALLVKTFELDWKNAVALH